MQLPASHGMLWQAQTSWNQSLQASGLDWGLQASSFPQGFD